MTDCKLGRWRIVEMCLSWYRKFVWSWTTAVQRCWMKRLNDPSKSAATVISRQLCRVRSFCWHRCQYSSEVALHRRQGIRLGWPLLDLSAAWRTSSTMERFVYFLCCLFLATPYSSNGVCSAIACCPSVRPSVCPSVVEVWFSHVSWSTSNVNNYVSAVAL